MALAGTLVGLWALAERLRPPALSPAYGWLAPVAQWCGLPGGAPMAGGLALAPAMLAAGTLVAMGPCLAQMGLVLAALWCGMTPLGLDTVPPRLRLRLAAPAALQFGGGYGLVFLPAALAVLLAGGCSFPTIEFCERPGAPCWSGSASCREPEGSAGPATVVQRLPGKSAAGALRPS